MLVFDLTVPLGQGLLILPGRQISRFWYIPTLIPGRYDFKSCITGSTSTNSLLLENQFLVYTINILKMYKMGAILFVLLVTSVGNRNK